MTSGNTSHAPGTAGRLSPETPPDAQPRHGVNLRRTETWLNLVWVVLGLAVCAYAFHLKIYGSNGPATGFFPLLAGLLMLATGIALSWSRATRVASELHFWPESGSARRVLSVLGGMLALIVLMRYAGFIIASLLMMPLLLRAIENRSWRFAILVGAFSAAVVYVTFDTLLGTLLPRSPLGF